MPVNMSTENNQATTGPLIVAPADVLHVILDKMKRFEWRMEDRLNQLKMELHCTQDEAFQRATKKAK